MRQPVILGLIVLVAMIGAACGSGDRSADEPASVSEDPTPTAPASTQADSATSSAENSTSGETDTKQFLVDPQLLMAAALRDTFKGDSTAIQSMGATGDPSYIPVLIELLRYAGFDGSASLSISSTLD